MHKQDVRRELVKKKNSRKVQTELDVIVYKIYNLTFSEIMKIDPEFSLSREEYENITLEE